MRFEEPPSAEDFEFALGRKLVRARREGRSELEVSAGDLHREIGGYPGSNHRMPVCCSVIRDSMTETDTILEEPPSGKGASLTVRFRLG